VFGNTVVGERLGESNSNFLVFILFLQKFAAVNGILFPGGGTSLKDGPFYDVAQKLFKVCKNAKFS
jgi:hypothetical protein